MDRKQLNEFIETGSLEDIKQSISSREIWRGQSDKLLEFSIKHGRLDVIKYLIEERYHDISFCFSKAYIKSMPMYFEKNGLEIFKYFLEKNIIQSENLEKDNFLYNCLVDSNNDSRFDIVKFLVEEKNYDVRINDNDALLEASRGNNPEIIQYLINHGSDVTDYNYGAYSLAASFGYFEVLEVLEKNNGEPKPNGNNSLFKVIDHFESTHPMVLYLINKGWTLSDEYCKEHEHSHFVEQEKIEEVKKFIDYYNLNKQLQKELPKEDKDIKPKHKL